MPHIATSSAAHLVLCASLGVAATLGAASVTPVAAATDESVPIYPHTYALGKAHTPTNEQAVSHAIEQGTTLNIYTGDSPEAVDRWYAQSLPKACVRTVTEGAHVYRFVCAKRTVNILPYQGQTSINIGPNTSS